MIGWAVAGVVTGSAFASQSASAQPRVFAVDGAGVARAAEHARASLERTPPSAAPLRPMARHSDPDAKSYVVAGAATEVPSVIDIVSRGANGAQIAVLRRVPLAPIPCRLEWGTSVVCRASAPIRVAADEVDAGHPLVRGRSVEGELGGGLDLLGAGGVVLATIRVSAPREMEAGAIDRLRGKLRFVAVRLAAEGALPVGGTTAGLRRVAVGAVERVNALWGACGISFGPADEVLVEVVDPPPSHLLAVGCDHGLPASGGELRFRVGDGRSTRPGRAVTVSLDTHMAPPAAARRVAEVLERAGWSATVSDNPAMAAGAGPTSDVLVRSKDGRLARLDQPAAGALSSDATLDACIGAVDLEDGLQHFTDVDSMVGTVEERSLIKAFDDHDPTTIEVVLIAGFGGGGRIGESFIGSDGGSMRNVVIIDRAGVKSNRASFTLAHELGHVLLDDPGHPDDFGVDLPTRLMDADAADGSAFGPRRLSLDECRRAFHQSGPDAPTALLRHWPLEPLPRSPSPVSWAWPRWSVWPRLPAFAERQGIRAFF